MKRNAPWRADYVSLPWLGNVELLHGTNLTHDYPPHIHEQLCIVMVQAGSERTVRRGSSYTARRGSIFIVHPEELHSSYSRNAEYRVFKIPEKEFLRIASELYNGLTPEAPYFSDFAIHDVSAFQSLIRVHQKLEQNDSQLEQESELIYALAMLLERHNHRYSLMKNTGKEDRYVEIVRSFLKERYTENISLSELCSLTHLSRFHLLRVFQNKIGVPPHEFQTQLRIAHARKLIRNGSSFTDAALATGFFDQSHLSRHFKRIVGMTPGQYFAGSNIVQEPTP